MKFLLFSIIILSICYSDVNEKGVLNKTQALELAVQISNVDCEKSFGVTPFETNSYAIAFKNNLWTWGALDVRGINGYSVSVKFDKYGQNDIVQVFFSEDVKTYSEKEIEKFRENN